MLMTHSLVAFNDLSNQLVILPDSQLPDPGLQFGALRPENFHDLKYKDMRIYQSIASTLVVIALMTTRPASLTMNLQSRPPAKLSW
jgi:hypothetical protein